MNSAQKNKLSIILKILCVIFNLMLGILGDLSLFTSNLALFSGADYSGVFISIIITILGNIGFFFLCKNKLDIDIWDWIWSWSKFTIIPYVLGFISPFLWWWTR